MTMQRVERVGRNFDLGVGLEAPLLAGPNGACIAASKGRADLHFVSIVAEVDDLRGHESRRIAIGQLAKREG